MKKAVTVLKSIAVMSLAALILFFSKETAESIETSIDICISSIIPSMFAFMILSAYIINSGLYRVIFRPLYFILKKIIKSDELSFSVFILSLIGGYPTGAKLIKETLSENRDYIRIAPRILSFSYCISPTFALVMLGKGVFGSIEAGAVIYISNIISCFICAIFVSWKTDCIYEAKHISSAAKSNPLIKSVNAASSALMAVCTVLIAFNVPISIFERICGFINLSIPEKFYGILEISNLLKSGVTLNDLPFVSMISSFGGVCVILQTAAIIGKEYPIKFFLLSRIPCAVMSYLITLLIINCHEIALETGTGGNIIYTFNADKALIPIIIIMCIIIFKESNKNFKKV